MDDVPPNPGGAERATRGTDGCSLCGLPPPEPPVTDPDVDGAYCCRGCLDVERVLGDVDDAVAERVESGLESGKTEPTQGELPSDDAEEAFLAVSGMHCSTCEVFLEARAGAVDGVYSAEANYASDTIRVVYDPEAVDADTITDTLSEYGYEATGRGESADDRPRDAALVNFLIGGGLFGMMVMVWYGVFLYPTYLGYEPPVTFSGYDGRYVFAHVWLLTSFVLFYTGYPILRGAFVSLRAGVPNMDLLIAVAALGSYAYSTLTLALGRSDLYFDVTVTIVLAVTAGAYYESVIKRRASGLLAELTGGQVEEARLEDGTTVAIGDVHPGERLLVRPGERVPLDGEVIEGSAAVDESLITGESVPVEKSPGDAVVGGTIPRDAALVVRVGPDASSTLDRLVSLLWRIQSTRPGVQRVADRLATVFVPFVLLLAAGTTALALAAGAAPSSAILVGLTVVIVSCPCSLGLATPLAVAAGVKEAANRGIVVAAETLFEDAPDVEIVVLDKTGTLTAGEMTVTDVVAVETTTETELLELAGAVERRSSHPIGEAIVDRAEEGRVSDGTAVSDGGTAVDTGSTEGGATADVDGFSSHDRGVSGIVDGEAVVVGHPALLERRGLTMENSLAERASVARTEGEVPVLVGWGGRARGAIVVGDVPRDGWDATVERLGAERSVVVLTGDQGATAERFRDATGVDDVFSGVPPAAKAETVERLRSRGPVAMVGDGSNDAPALAAADVGIALGSGTDLATEAADVVLVGDDLDRIPSVFGVAETTNRRIRENLAWAFVYNAIAIPLAVSGLLSPLFAALAMALSSLLVVANSARAFR